MNTSTSSTISPQIAIEIKSLVKIYGDKTAVNGIDLTVTKGEIFALLGPNGAGKTTTVEILEGFRNLTSGEVKVLDFDPATKGRGWSKVAKPNWNCFAINNRCCRFNGAGNS
jgi:ABC-2 type transport system ATP-binding protein